MGKMSGETKLFVVLGAIILLGGGFLFWSSRPPQLPSFPDAPEGQPTTAAKEVTQETFNDLIKNARYAKGPENAEITIVEFGDVECPSCRRSFAMFDPHISKSDKARFYFLHLPLEMHPRAMPAAIAMEAAGRQGKFWEMYSALFTGETTTLSDEFIEKSAQQIGLNMERFRQDMEDPKIVETINADQKLAERHGIDTTPTFLVKTRDGKVVRAVGPREMRVVMQQNGLMAAPAMNPDAGMMAEPGT